MTSRSESRQPVRGRTKIVHNEFHVVAEWKCDVVRLPSWLGGDAATQHLVLRSERKVPCGWSGPTRDAFLDPAIVCTRTWLDVGIFDEDTLTLARLLDYKTLRTNVVKWLSQGFGLVPYVDGSRRLVLAPVDVRDHGEIPEQLPTYRDLQRAGKIPWF